MLAGGAGDARANVADLRAMGLTCVPLAELPAALEGEAAGGGGRGHAAANRWATCMRIRAPGLDSPCTA
ncbi:hypothetical protein [Desulfocurvus vexinensis]|uniref:hypothetical protein n=1 Tax=Desulfocurvus vexinensis TaxID=399548 RepID=UPI00048BF522|nr:hypothetical protein [Desulfocurvus vexinensis]